ncbi:MAG TPA: phosphatidate cytidylyltransferase [Planctomycetota bacterium]|jgi:phosphatidate cytidylyltransferase
MLGQRFFAAVMMIASLAAAMAFDFYLLKDGILLHAFFLLMAFLSFREFWPLCRATGHQTFSVWGTLSGCGLVAVHYWAMRLSVESGSREAHQLASDLLTGGLAVAVLGAFLLTAKRHEFKASLGGVAVTCLGLLYIYFLPSFLLRLRYVGVDGLVGGKDWNLYGNWMVVSTIVLAKGCDVWAYLVGRALGRHKAFPELSPGKTIEGVAAGLIGSVLTALLLWWKPIGILSFLSPWKVCVLGLIIGVAGIMGDLAESLLKRSAGAKDAGNVVPGYGGAMDVVDSLMVAGPVAYFVFPAMM